MKITDSNIEQAQDFQQVNANDFEESEPNNPTRLTLITREFDNLCHWVLAGEGQPTGALHHIKCKLQRLSTALCQSAPPGPLNNILKQYMDTPCFAQKQKTLQTP